MNEEDRRTFSETYERPPVSVDGAELRGVISFPPTARLVADLGGIDWLFDRILRWTCHPTRPRTFQGRSLHPGSITRSYGREVSASCRPCKRSVTRGESPKSRNGENCRAAANPKNADAISRARKLAAAAAAAAAAAGPRRPRTGTRLGGHDAGGSRVKFQTSSGC